MENSNAGYAWPVDDWTRLRRFLILGSEGSSYYASEWNLTRENAEALERAVRDDGPRTVDEIVAVSREGRAPKNEPALFALALAAGVGDMGGGCVAGVPGLSPRDASAALALVTAATESSYEIVGFFAGNGGFTTGRKRGRGWGDDGVTPLPLSPRQRLDDAGQGGLEPAVRRHGLCAADAVRAGARA